MARALLAGPGLLAALACLPAGCGPSAPPALRLSGAIMGTTWHATVVAPEEAGQRVRLAIEQALAQVDAAMSPWKPESDLARFNRAGAEESIALDPGLLSVVALALEIHALSHGAFDPTVGPLVDLWGFGPPEPSPAPPSSEALAAARALVGLGRLVRLDRAAGTLLKTAPGVRLDLSAVAKGHAVDRAAQALADLGFQDLLLEVGGEVVARGHRPAGGPWRLEIEQAAPGPSHPLLRVLLSNQALATSGDYRNRRRFADGTTAHHILDPRTGTPTPARVAAASVIAPDCARADALATALMVLGEQGLALIESLAGVEALLQLRDGEDLRLVRSSGFAAYEAGG